MVGWLAGAQSAAMIAAGELRRALVPEGPRGPPRCYLDGSRRDRSGGRRGQEASRPGGAELAPDGGERLDLLADDASL
jgi:hypothetical protein